jgi:hypothetical protein
MCNQINNSFDFALVVAMGVIIFSGGFFCGTVHDYITHKNAIELGYFLDDSAIEQAKKNKEEYFKLKEVEKSEKTYGIGN